MIRRLLLLSLALTGCTSRTEVADVTAALGQPTGDYPGYDERVVLYATNRARTDPTKAGWSSYPAQPPLQWNYDLNRSSRAHSVDMRDTPCFQHPSCNGTDTFTRINSFYTGNWSNEGENISAGVPDGVTAVYNWIYEIGAAAGETGHRDNIFSKDFTLVGNGFAAGGTTYKNYWTQDFVGTTVTRPHLTDGIHFPVSGANITFGATYYDAGGKAATRFEVIIDGACHALPLARGTAGNATYEAMLAVATGCHQYYFRSTTGGVDSTYPDTGSLGVAGGSGTCALFVAGHTAPTCDGNTTPADMTTTGPVADLGGGKPQDGGVDPSGGGGGDSDMTIGGVGGGGGDPGGSGGGGGGGGGGSGGGAGTGHQGGTGCTIAGASAPSAFAFGLFGFVWVVLLIGRRRRA